MNYKSFPSEYLANVEQTLQQLKSENMQPLAAFDADGTLWDTDLGENFFQYQIDHKLIQLPPDPWTHYLEMKKVNGDPRNAYSWLAQINHGVPLEKLREWSNAAYESVHPKPLFSEQRKMIDLLLSYGAEVYVVTASITWAVEPGAAAMGLKPSNVIGVETAVKNGVITTEKLTPITYRAGKVDALLQRTGGRLPFLCSGNTIGDFELLQSATHFQLAVSAASRDDKLLKAENELQNIAAEKTGGGTALYERSYSTYTSHCDCHLCGGWRLRYSSEFPGQGSKAQIRNEKAVTLSRFLRGYNKPRRIEIFSYTKRFDADVEEIKKMTVPVDENSTFYITVQFFTDENDPTAPLVAQVRFMDIETDNMVKEESINL